MNDHSQRLKRASSGGFTLLEAMIAMVLFAVTIAGIFQMLSQSFKTAESARDLNRVTQILQYQIEDLRGSNWSTLTAKEGETSILVDAYGIPGSASDVTPFDWQAFSMKQNTTVVAADYIDVTLVVNWTDVQGRSHSQSFKTSFTENGLNAYYARSI